MDVQHWLRQVRWVCGAVTMMVRVSCRLAGRHVFARLITLFTTCSSGHARYGAADVCQDQHTSPQQPPLLHLSATDGTEVSQVVCCANLIGQRLKTGCGSFDLGTAQTACGGL